MFAEVSSANRTVIFTLKRTPGKKLRSESLLAFLKANLVLTLKSLYCTDVVKQAVQLIRGPPKLSTNNQNQGKELYWCLTTHIISLSRWVIQNLEFWFFDTTLPLNV
jgi:hypothetical protein